MSTVDRPKSAAQRRTIQRQIILEELQKLKTHPRSDELYSLVRQRLPRVSLGTVYRNLARLQREGQALEIYCGDFIRYDGDISAHDHFICRACRRVWDFGGGHSHPSEGEPPRRDWAGFLVESQYTMFSGLCPECSEQTVEGPQLSSSSFPLSA